jgi:phytoene dehydrogenase-like protein
MTNWMEYTPWQFKEGSWSDVKQELEQLYKDILTEYAPNFRDSLIDWTLQTPEDMAGRESATNGNIHHTDMVPSQLLSRRMPYRSPISGLYLCGSGTHPGEEVTGAPGHNAAKAILKDLERMAIA